MREEMNSHALVVVDMLYDFIDGSLACINAEDAVRRTAELIESMNMNQDEDENGISGTFPVMFIRDHHPSGHISFKENGGIWPVHCVAGTHGGEIHKDLLPYASEELTFDKGCYADVEQYSGFEGMNPAGQSLGEILEMLDTTDVHVCGIATEFCVRNTCEDLKRAGFNVHLHQECVAYVDHEGHMKALKEMAEEGIRIE